MALSTTWTSAAAAASPSAAALREPGLVSHVDGDRGRRGGPGDDQGTADVAEFVAQVWAALSAVLARRRLTVWASAGRLV